jgi:ectoine hydroxylase-related dioxygenase (phytanoyl-CoA dioxygenase family)
MQTLDRSQVAQYEEHGFLVVENVLTEEELDALRRRTEDIAEGRLEHFPDENIQLEPNARWVRNSKTVRKLDSCAENDALYLAHAKKENTLDLVEALIGKNIKLFGSQLFMKPPGGVEKPYHQDSAYFTIEPMSLVTCWTALDDVTVENGCMWVIPGSHRQGAIDHSQQWMIGDRKDKQVPQSAFDRTAETPITIPAGGCSFHHSLLLHSSRPNRTPHPRRGLAIHYMSAGSRWTHPTDPQPAYMLLRGSELPGCV